MKHPLRFCFTLWAFLCLPALFSVHAAPQQELVSATTHGWASVPSPKISTITHNKAKVTYEDTANRRGSNHRRLRNKVAAGIASNVKAVLKSLGRASNFQVVDGELNFGNVPPGFRATSRDTFTLSGNSPKPPSVQVLSKWLRRDVSTNAPPVADAGSDQTVRIGDAVALDGSGSTDGDGDSLSYHWALLAKPTGSSAQLNDPLAVGPVFEVDQPGDYVLQLVVHDGTTDSPADTVTISTENSAPQADAGPDRTLPVRTLVTLDGTHSRDADGDSLTHAWTC